MKCLASQYSDQMICDHCAIAWDVNDPSPPQCGGFTRKLVQENMRLREALKKVELRSGETHIVDLARSALQQKESE